MHILFLPVSYPNKYNEASGIFFRDQALALSGSCKVGVIALVGVSIKDILKKFKMYLGFTRRKDFIDIWQYQYLSLPKLGLINNFIRLQIGKRIFKKYLKENGLPDIVHVHVFLAGDLAVWIKRTYGIPYVVTEHSSLFLGNGDLSWWHKIILKRVYLLSNANVSVSRRLKNTLDSHYNIKSFVIPNTLDTAFFNVGNNNIKNKDDFIFLNVANLNPNKDHAILIWAFKKLLTTHPSCKLIIAGGGAEESNLRTLIAKLDLSEVVSLLGHVSKEDVRFLMAKSNCFILTSHNETFGVVLIEAMSSGLPIVSTKSGGPEDIITNGNIGVLCDVNVDSIASAMKTVMINKYDSAYIRDKAVETFSYNAFRNRIMPIYNRVVNGNSL